MLSQTLNIERISFGILLIITGIFSMFVAISSIQTWLGIIDRFIAQQGGSINYFFFLKTFHHTIILSIISIVCAFLIFSKKSLGWTIGIALCAYHCIFYSKILFEIFFGSTPNSGREDDTFIPIVLTIFLVLTGLFLLGFFLLLLTKIRTQFNTGKKEYWTVTGLTILFCADKILF